MIPPRSFWLIRHGQTDANRDGIIAGTTEAQLTDAGRASARALAGRDWPAPFSLFSSPQQRAVETAALAFPGRTPILVPDLRERNWGDAEGRPLAELPPRTETPPNGEGWEAFLTRVERALTLCLSQSPRALPVIVAHSGVIRAARALTGGAFDGPSPPNAVPIRFDRQDGGWCNGGSPAAHRTVP